MEEELSKRIEELGELRRIVCTPEKAVVEALEIHAKLVDLLADSNEELVKASEKLERWTTASVFLAITLVFLTFALLFVGGVQALGPDVRQTLPNWAGKAWAVFLGVAFVTFAVAVVFAVIYFAKAQKALVLPKRKG